MKTNLPRLLVAAVFASLLLTQPATGFAQTSAFTYQGRLEVAGSPANGRYDFRCLLYNASSPPEMVVAGSVTNLAVAVSNGLFTLTLDFGADVFTGQERWLSVQVRTNNPALAFTVLSPRQRLTPAPYSIHALKAASFQDGAAPTFTGTVAFNPPSGAPFTVGSATKVMNLNADFLDGLDSTAFVRKTGDTMTGKLTVNGPGGTATFSDIGVLFGNDIAVSGQASSVFGVGVMALASGTGGNAVNAQASGGDGVGIYTEASNGSNARGITARSTTGLAGYFDGALRVQYSSPFAKPQLQITEPADNGFARLRMHTGSRAFWDVAVGTGVNATNSMRFYNSTNGDVMTLSETGNLFVRVLTITGGADIAEPFQMSQADLPKGAVVVIDEDNPGHLKLSTMPYDRQVAGVISGAGGVNPGLSLSQQGVMEGSQHVALTGRVFVQADAAAGAIRPGDLLTTSATPGHAMRVSDFARAPGAVLGKAMTGLKEGTGLVLVLVALQ